MRKKVEKLIGIILAVLVALAAVMIPAEKTYAWDGQELGGLAYFSFDYNKAI